MEADIPDHVHCPRCGSSWSLTCHWVIKIELHRSPLALILALLLTSLGVALDFSGFEILAFVVPACCVVMVSFARRVFCSACNVEFSFIKEPRKAT